MDQAARVAALQLEREQLRLSGADTAALERNRRELVAGFQAWNAELLRQFAPAD